VEGGGGTEGSGGAESGGRMEGSLGLREGGTGSSGGGGTEAVTRNGAFGPETHYSHTCQHLTDDIGFVYSVKEKEEGNGSGAILVPVHLIYSIFFVHC
jgi:hypothetical protein